MAAISAQVACRRLGIVDGAGNDGMVGELGLGRNSVSPGSVLKRDL